MYLENIVERSKYVRVNPFYDIGTKNMTEIYEAFKDDPAEMIITAFKIGYLQGQKAQRGNKNEESSFV